MTIFHSATIEQSPIGNIPVDFVRHSDLCRAAFIRYHDSEVKNMKVRSWRIIVDGKTNGHHKFCLLLDFLAWKFPQWSRKDILEAAMTNSLPDCKRLLAMRWQDFHNELAFLGVPNYQTLQSKNKHKEIDIDL